MSRTHARGMDRIACLPLARQPAGVYHSSGGINSTVRAKLVRVAKGIGPKQASHRVLSGSPWMHSADLFLGGDGLGYWDEPRTSLNVEPLNVVGHGTF